MDDGNSETRNKYNKYSKKHYGSASAYADSVRAWMMSYHCWAMSQHLLMLQSRTALPVPSPAPPQVPSVTRTIFNCAPLSRRLFAELIDFVFVFAAKLFIVYLFVETNLFSLDRYDRLLSDQADLQTLIDMTQELFPLEVLSKLLSSILEAFCISYGLRLAPPGCTPGKLLMGIRVIHYRELEAIPFQPETVAVIDAGNVPLANSILRCLLKNLLLSFLFPLSIVVYAFQFNRAIYDIWSHTIVVQM